MNFQKLYNESAKKLQFHNDSPILMFLIEKQVMFILFVDARKW